MNNGHIKAYRFFLKGTCSNKQFAMFPGSLSNFMVNFLTCRQCIISNTKGTGIFADNCITQLNYYINYIRIYIYIYIYICIHMHIYKYECIYIIRYMYMSICICICIYGYGYVCIHTKRYVSLYIFIIFIYRYMYMYFCI